MKCNQFCKSCHGQSCDNASITQIIPDDDNEDVNEINNNDDNEEKDEEEVSTVNSPCDEVDEFIAEFNAPIYEMEMDFDQY